MTNKNSKVVRLRNDVLAQARESATHLTGRKDLPDAEAIAACVYGSSRESHERLVDMLQAKTTAATIANVVAAVEQLTGQHCDVRVDRDHWWIALQEEGNGYPLGRADPSLVTTELAKMGREIALRAQVN